MLTPGRKFFSIIFRILWRPHRLARELRHGFRMSGAAGALATPRLGEPPLRDHVRPQPAVRHRAGRPDPVAGIGGRGRVRIPEPAGGPEPAGESERAGRPDCADAWFGRGRHGVRREVRTGRNPFAGRGEGHGRNSHRLPAGSDATARAPGPSCGRRIGVCRRGQGHDSGARRRRRRSRQASARSASTGPASDLGGRAARPPPDDAIGTRRKGARSQDQ